MPRRGRGQGQGQGQAQSHARFSTVVHTNSGRRHIRALRNNTKNTRGRPGVSSYGYSSRARRGPVHEDGESYYQTGEEFEHARHNRRFNRNRNFGNGISGGSRTRRKSSGKSRKSRKNRR